MIIFYADIECIAVLKTKANSPLPVNADISILFHPLASGQYAYRLYLSVGDHEYPCLGVDMTGSPGLAAATFTVRAGPTLLR